MKFILTKELGRLSKWLRILGYDTVYFTQENKGLLLVEALRDNRIILTRNSRMPQAKGIRIINIASDYLQDQMRQLFKDLNIKPDEDTMFSRCTICNAELSQIDKDRAKDRVPEYVFKTQDDFLTCCQCGRIYWQGTHWGNVSKILEEIRGAG